MFSKKAILNLVVIAATISACHKNSSNDQSSTGIPSPRFVDGEVIVALKDSAMLSSGKASFQKQAAKSFAAKSVHKLGTAKRYLKLSLNESENVDQAIERLKSHQDVEFVQPNYIYRLMAPPDDPKYGQLWGLKNNGQTITSINSAQDDVRAENNPGTAGFDIGAESAWNLITDCSSVTVAVLDSGANLEHEDLVNNLWSSSIHFNKHGFNAVDQNYDPIDTLGHGTHVSTTIGAQGNNGKGSTGVCWKSKIMPVKVCGSSECKTSDIIAGIAFATANGAKIINMSLAGTGAGPAEIDVIKNATNTLFVVAAGNDSNNNDIIAYYPCNHSTSLPNVICVGAVNQAFAAASFSNYGTTSVQISAPGTNILGGSPTSEVVTPDSFGSGWNGDGANWGTSASSLVNPINYDGTTSLYSNSLRSAVYKTYNFSNATSVHVELNVTHSLENGYDFLRIGWDRGTGVNIFSSPSVNFAEWPNPLTGIAIDSFQKFPYNLGDGSIDISSTCAGQANCTLGFQLQSDFFTRSFGVKITNLQFRTINPSTNSYKIINGTSMATPHVTGVAALLAAYNPQMTASQMRTAIMAGGKSMAGLANRNATGKVLNAMGALTYISKPSLPSAKVK